MSIIIKFLLATCLLVRFTNGASTDDSTLEPGGSVDEMVDTDEINADGSTRSKRLYSTQLKEALDKINLSLGKSLVPNPLLGGIPALQSKPKLSLFDKPKTALGAKIAEAIRTKTLRNPFAPAQPLLGQSLDGCLSHVPEKPKQLESPEENASLGEAKPIVLPDYLMNKDKQKHQKVSPNVITERQLQETAELRKEIDNAVKNHLYVHSASDLKNQIPSEMAAVAAEEQVIPMPVPEVTPAYNPFSIEQFFSNIWSNWIKPVRIQQSLASDEPTIGSSRSDFSYVDNSNKMPPPNEKAHPMGNLPQSAKLPSETKDDVHPFDATVDDMMAEAANRAKTEGIVSNIVESYANNEDTPELEASAMKEELNITSITEDMRFNIGEQVIRWRTLQRQNQESHALIGITKSSVVLVLERDGVFKLQTEVALLTKPTFFATFTSWNETQRSIDGIVVVSLQHEIMFYRVNEAMDKMEFLWMWPVNSDVKYLHHFVVDNNDLLLIITDSQAGSSASLYRFDLNRREYFLREGLSLKSKARNMALIQSGHDTFICFPQEGHVIIFKYQQDRFKYFTEIESQHADTLSSFEMGGYSYLAIGGTSPRILRYFHGNFINQTLLNKSWGFVEYFLPVPARTYRDDLIIFVQHRMDYSSHSTNFLEALVWNGHAFRPAYSVPCYVNQHPSELGMGCMLDQDREMGIIGATTYQRNRTISVLVPRHEAPSGLFDLQIDLLPASSTINEHLLEVLSEIIILLDTRAEVLKRAQEVIDKFPKEPMKAVTLENKHIDAIHTHHLDLGSTIPTEGVYLGEELITKEEVDTFLKVLNETEETIKRLEESKRSKRDGEDSPKVFQVKTLDVSELEVEYINGVPFEEFIFVENGSLSIDGTVVLTQTIQVERVERLRDDAFLQMQKDVPEITIVEGDLTFDEINGIKWKDFINQIVMTNVPNSIDELQVNGAVVMEDAVIVENLNDIAFPDGFVRTDGEEEITVVGKKTFTGVLCTEVLESFGTLNGIDPSDIITLSTKQFIPGITTFKNLEVVDTLVIEENATISGRHLDEFLSNPTLRETNQIHSNCIFKSLEIEEPMFVQNRMNDMVVDDVLSDVVYKHEPDVVISSLKRFTEVQAEMLLTANRVNNIPFSMFVTKDTEQTFNVTKLQANVFFQNLEIGGLYDFVNITELDMNSLKKFGDQYTDAELIFEDGDFVNIDAAQFEVLDTINGVNVTDYISIDENIELSNTIVVDTLSANNLVLKGEIKGSPDIPVNGVRLQDLVDSHLSKTKAQNFTEPIYIKKAVIRNGFNAGTLNGHDFQKAVEILKNMKTNEQMLNESVVRVDEMIVNGNITFTEVNGFDFAKIQANAIRLDQPNVINFPITFLDPIYVNGNLTVDSMNGKHFDTFVKDLVRKSANTNRVYGTTVFRGNVTVVNNVDVMTLNGISVDSILTKNYNREISTPIDIHGDVYVPSLFVKGTLNGLTADKINAYGYDEESDTYFLKKNVYFNDRIHATKLNLHGGFNSIPNVRKHLKEIIRTDRPAVITGTKTFTGTVHFDNDIYIKEYNGVDVPDFLSNVVFIDQETPVDIYEDVVFDAPVSMPYLKIDGDLMTAKINNNSVEDWVKKSIRIDRPFSYNGTIQFANGSITATNINTQYLNDLPIDEMITLTTPQNFSRPVHLNNVYSVVPMLTEGLVSGYHLPDERKNTLMTYGNQRLEIPTVFSSIRVLRNLVTNGLVNARDLRLAVPLNKNVYIDSPLSFKTVSVNKLFTKNLISGVNFDEWVADAFVRQSVAPQVVTAPWSIKDGIAETVVAEQQINGKDMHEFLAHINETAHAHESNFKDKCKAARKVIKESRDNEVFLSHFSSAFSINTPVPINSIHLLNAFHKNYMVMNYGCDTSLYSWNDQTNAYEPFTTTTTGVVNQWVHVHDADDELFLISNNDGSVSMECAISGAFIWKFNPTDVRLEQLMKLGTAGVFRSMQKKRNSRAFFYVLRNTDQHVLEYNLQGSIVTEWSLDNFTAPRTSSVHFMPNKANLGLALSDGNQLSHLKDCNCTKRAKRCLLPLIAEFANLKPDQLPNLDQPSWQKKWEPNRDVWRSIFMPQESPRLYQTHDPKASSTRQKAKKPKCKKIGSGENVKTIPSDDSLPVTTESSLGRNAEEEVASVTISSGSGHEPSVDPVHHVLNELTEDEQSKEEELNNPEISESVAKEETESHNHGVDDVGSMSENDEIHEENGEDSTNDSKDSPLNMYLIVAEEDDDTNHNAREGVEDTFTDEHNHNHNQMTEHETDNVESSSPNAHDDQKPQQHSNMLDCDFGKDSVQQVLNALSDADHNQHSSSSHSEKDPKVGDTFNDILEKLTPVADDFMDKFSDNVRKTESQGIYNGQYQSYIASSAKEHKQQGMVGSTHAEDKLNDEKASQSHMLDCESAASSAQHVSNALSDTNHNQHSSSSHSEKDPKVGDTFNDILEKLTPVADDFMDKISGKVRKTESQGTYDGQYQSDPYIASSAKKHKQQGTVGSTHAEDKLNDEKALQSHKLDCDCVQHVLNALSVYSQLKPHPQNKKEQHELVGSSRINAELEHKMALQRILNLIAKAETISSKRNPSSATLENELDPKVGDTFNDVLEKLTPVGDDIMDKIADLVRNMRENGKIEDNYQYDPYTVGTSQNAAGSDPTLGSTTAKITSYFKKVGKSLVKVYVFGKDHFNNAFNDVKYMYNTYKKAPKEKEESVPKSMPTSEEFSNAFAIEMIKSFRNNSQENNDNGKKNFWSIVRSGVITAFELHMNSSGHVPKTNETANEEILQQFLQIFNETMEKEARKPNTADEQLGSALCGLDAEKSKTDAQKLDEPFLKLSPLIDFLSEKIVSNLLDRQRLSEEQRVGTTKSRNGDANVSAIRGDPSKQSHTFDCDPSKESVKHVLNALSDAGHSHFKANRMNEKDPKVGDTFNDALEKLTPIADDFMDKIAENVRKMESKGKFEDQYASDQYISSPAKEHEIVGSSHDEWEHDKSLQRILSLISKAETISSKRNPSSATSENELDPKVGDTFNDVLEKLTPLADDIMDKFAEHVWKKQSQGKYEDNYQYDPYTVGYARSSGDSEDDIGVVPKEVSRFFTTIGQPLVKMYAFGKKSFKEAKNVLRDMKTLVMTYSDNFAEDNLNDNKSYGSSTETKDSIDYKKEYETVVKMVPNMKNFSDSFAVEMMKAMGNASAAVNGSTENFWPIIKNCMKSALQGQDSEGIDAGSGKKMLQEFLRTLNDTVQQANQAKEEKVGSSLSSQSSSDNMVGSETTELFNKFVPVVDYLVGNIVNKLWEDQQSHTQDQQVSQAHVMPKTYSSENTCIQNITMEQFIRKLEELERSYRESLFQAIEEMRSAKLRVRRDIGRSSEMETTLVSIPNALNQTHQNSEIVAIRVATTNQLLIAVSSISESKIKSNHDQIQIFEDIIDGKLFQSIACYKPRSLIAFNINMDTVLAFIQDDSEVKTYIFRGEQGFVEFMSFRMPSPIKQMIHNEIVEHENRFLCPEHYLVLVTENQVNFVKAVTIGDCIINENLNC